MKDCIKVLYITDAFHAFRKSYGKILNINRLRNNCSPQRQQLTSCIRTFPFLQFVALCYTIIGLTANPMSGDKEQETAITTKIHCLQHLTTLVCMEGCPSYEVSSVPTKPCDIYLRCRWIDLAILTKCIFLLILTSTHSITFINTALLLAVFIMSNNLQLTTCWFTNRFCLSSWQNSQKKEWEV